MRRMLLLVQALAGLLAYDIVVRVGKFKTVRKLVSNWKTKPHQTTPDAAEQVIRAINLACICYPKQALCLQRSAVTVCLMRSHGIAAHMVLGAQKIPFAAHAWVEVNGKAVNERRNVRAIYNVWESC